MHTRRYRYYNPSPRSQVDSGTRNRYPARDIRRRLHRVSLDRGLRVSRTSDRGILEHIDISVRSPGRRKCLHVHK